MRGAAVCTTSSSSLPGRRRAACSRPQCTRAAADASVSVAPASCSSRAAAAGLLLAGLAPSWSRPPPACAADSSFYSQWPYVTPSDILPYIRATAKEGAHRRFHRLC